MDSQHASIYAPSAWILKFMFRVAALIYTKPPLQEDSTATGTVKSTSLAFTFSPAFPDTPEFLTTVKNSHILRL